MFAFVIHERDSGRTFLGRDRFGIKPLYLSEAGSRAAVRLDPAGARGRRRPRHLDRPGRAAPLPDRSTPSCPRRTPSSTGSARSHRRRRSRSSPTGRATPGRVLAPRLHPRPRPGRLDRARLGGRGPPGRCARRSSGVSSPTCPSACCCRAASTRRSWSACSPRPARRDLATFSIGFESFGGEEGDEFKYSDVIAARVRDRPPPAAHRHRPDAARPRRRGRRHGRTDGLPRRRGVLPAVAGGRPSTSRSCSRGRAPTRCSPATTGTRRCRR